MVEQDTLDINDRALLLLKVIVERYICEGQPIASKSLADHLPLSLSSATIRNVMADLETRGYLISPHTSAGRVPTTKGYRLFVNQLLNVKPVDEHILDKLHLQINSVKDKNSLLQSTTTLLSQISHLAGIVSIPVPNQQILRHVEFLSLSDNRVLVILVLNQREVHNRIIHMEQSLTHSELEQVGNFLTATFQGKDLSSIHQELIATLHADRAQFDHLLQSAITVVEQAFAKPDSEQGYLLDGETNLLDIADDKSMAHLRNLFDAFNEKRTVLSLLEKCLRADGIQIFIGDDAGYDVFDGVSVITAPYKQNGQILGVLGVIGPNRMAYEQIIPLVDISAKLLSNALK